MVKSKTYKTNITLNKRKRGIIRKAIEMSTICNQQVYCVIADPKKKTFVEYKSCPKIDFNDYKNFEFYNDGDYDALSNKFITKKQLEDIQAKHRHDKREPGEFINIKDSANSEEQEVDNILRRLIPNFGKRLVPNFSSFPKSTPLMQKMKSNPNPVIHPKLPNFAFDTALES